MSQLILQPFRCFTYVTVRSPTLPSLYLRDGAKLILEPFRHFTYVTTHSPALPSLYVGHSSFSNHSVASSTSQFILQPFFRFSYVTSSSALALLPSAVANAMHETLCVCVCTAADDDYGKFSETYIIELLIEAIQEHDKFFTGCSMLCRKQQSNFSP